MNEQLVEFLKRQWPDADNITVENFEPIPGGYSRETFRFDARVRRGNTEETVPLILRRDPPAPVSILPTSRQTEHELIEAVRAHTSIPVSKSYGYELDRSHFGEAAMIIERMPGSGLVQGGSV